MTGKKGACAETARDEAGQLGHRKWRALPMSCGNRTCVEKSRNEFKVGK